MRIKRRLLIPVSLDIVRQRLTSAFISPLVLTEGNFMLARVECYGSIQGDTIAAMCVINGNAAMTRTMTYTMKGYVSDYLGKTRLEMTIKFDFSNPLYFLPLLVFLFLTLMNVFTGRPSLPFDRFDFSGLDALFFIGFVYAGFYWHLSSAASHFENMIRKCVLINPNDSPKTGIQP